MGSRKKKKAAARRWSSRVDPVMARRLGGGVLFVLVCGGIAAGLGLIGARVETRSREALRTMPVRFEFDWPRGHEGESWLPEAFRADLRHLASLHMGEHDPLSAEPLTRLGEALDASGWFDDVPMVRRMPGGVVKVAGSWRVPVASVRVLGNDLPVSRAGRIMPIPYEVGASDLPVVFGMQGLPPLRRDGSLDFRARWEARDLEAGLELLDVLRMEAGFDRIAGVDVSGLQGRGGLALLMENGARVRWGGRAGVFNPAEVPTEVKIERLRLLLASGRLDDPTLVVEIFHERGLLVAPPTRQGEG